MKNIFFGLIAIAFLVAGPVQAQEAGSEFDQGISLFNKEEYRSALEHFLAARAAGMDEPKLDYNMGLCYYKLGEYEQAKQALLRAAEYAPMRDLANYNIGLVEEARNRPADAKQWFQRVYDETDNANLKTLSSVKLGLSSQEKASAPNWFAGFATSIGYDDNIEDPTQLGVTGKGDSFVDTLLYGSTLLQGRYDDGLRLWADAYFLRYQDITAYDMNLVQANLDKTFWTGTWNDTVGLGLEHTTLGSTNFLRTAKLTLMGEKKLNTSDKLRLRYRYSDVASLDVLYDKLKGSRHQAEVRWERKSDSRRLRARYEFESNNRQDFQGTTIFTSYSPIRHTLELRGFFVPVMNWDLDARLELRRSTYADDNILAGGSHVKRQDDRVLVGARVSRKLYHSLKVNLEYKHMNNNSNIAFYTYTRNLYTLGLSGSF